MNESRMRSPVYESGFTQLLIDPFLDPLRGDPRFTKLLEEVGFDTV